MAEFTKEDAKQLKIDEASYEMYEQTKRETVRTMKEKTNEDGTRMYTQEQIDDQLKIIEKAQEDIVKDYVLHGGNPEEIAKKKQRKTRTVKSVDDAIFNDIVAEKPAVKETPREEKIESVDILPGRDVFDDNESYDMIPLPSKGEVYKGKIKKLPVAYLNAYDENMFVSPNLYRDNLLIDTILKNKILSDVIDPADLLEGDRDAIILWLRAGSYGPEYPITANDDVTGEEFDTVVDLSKIGFKPFKLKGDENGWFDYTLPVSKHEIKFRFLTHRDILRLKEIDEEENKNLLKDRVTDIVTRLDELIDVDTTLEKTAKIKTREAIRTLEKWSDEIDENDGPLFTHSVTNKLQAAIMSVDGITDRKMIAKFVRTMNVKDSSSLRKYILENEPGVDYNITIEKPESLGGGSMNIFLQLDQFIFLNIA